MAIRVDEAFLEKVGLASLPADEKGAFMQLAQTELETRVGQGLGKLLTPSELKEFEAITDPKQASAWLTNHAPTYREMTLEVYRNFQRELQADRDQILGQA